MAPTHGELYACWMDMAFYGTALEAIVKCLLVDAVACSGAQTFPPVGPATESLDGVRADLQADLLVLAEGKLIDETERHGLANLLLTALSDISEQVFNPARLGRAKEQVGDFLFTEEYAVGDGGKPEDIGEAGVDALCLASGFMAHRGTVKSCEVKLLEVAKKANALGASYSRLGRTFAELFMKGTTGALTVKCRERQVTADQLMALQLAAAEAVATMVRDWPRVGDASRFDHFMALYDPIRQEIMRANASSGVLVVDYDNLSVLYYGKTVTFSSKENGQQQGTAALNELYDRGTDGVMPDKLAKAVGMNVRNAQDRVSELMARVRKALMTAAETIEDHELREQALRNVKLLLPDKKRGEDEPYRAGKLDLWHVI